MLEYFLALKCRLEVEEINQHIHTLEENFEGLKRGPND
jgi:hypothetical protein